MTVQITLTAAQLTAIAAELSGLAAGTVAPPVQYPRDDVVDGVKIRLKAPLRADWKAPFGARIWYNAATAGTPVMPDPSNGDEANPPLPLRSPAGWPLAYALAGGRVVGTPTVLYDGQAFASDAEVEQYQRASAAYLANSLAGDDQNFLAGARSGRRDPPPVPPADENNETI